MERRQESKKTYRITKLGLRTPSERKNHFSTGPPLQAGRKLVAGHRCSVSQEENDKPQANF